jgi:hypothetical protein
LILAHPKEVVLLRDLGYRAKAIRTFAVSQVFFGPEAFARDAIPSVVIVLINLSAIIEVLKNLLNDFFMADFRGTDEIVVRNIHSLPEGLKSQDHFIAVCFRIHPSFLSSFFYLLAVFIRSREEEDSIPLEASVAGKDVSGYGRIRMTDMRDIIDIVDGSGDVKELFRVRMHES